MARSRMLSLLRRSAWMIVGTLICLFLPGFASPMTLESSWITEEGPSMTTGDVPACEAEFTPLEQSAVGSLHLLVNQDSPFFGVTSQAEKQIHFERAITAEREMKIALFAELTGTLRIQGGHGEVIVRAAAFILDAKTYLPVAGLEISTLTLAGRFSHAIDTPCTVNLADPGVQVATLPAGDYVVVGSIEATAAMSKGWWNHEAQADVFLSIDFLAGD